MTDELPTDGIPLPGQIWLWRVNKEPWEVVDVGFYQDLAPNFDEKNQGDVFHRYQLVATFKKQIDGGFLFDLVHNMNTPGQYKRLK